MGRVRIETRPGGSLLLTDTGSGRWGLAAAGVGAGGLLLASAVAGELTALGGAIALPFAVIAILAGIGAGRHRDWIVFDRPARQIVFRRGLAAMFRAVSTVPFDEVESIRVVEAGGTAAVELVRTGDLAWPIDESADAAHVSRLVTALHDAGDWPVLLGAARLHPPFRVTLAGSPGSRP